MILGQLYYYHKKLASLPSEISYSNIQEVDIYGVDTSDKDSYKGLEKSEIIFRVKEQFNNSFNKLLKEEKLRFASAFWKLISSPLIVQDFRLRPSTEFQYELIQWLQDGAKVENIKELLSQGLLETNEEDFAIYYGLKVLYTLISGGKIESEKIDLPFDTEVSDLSKNPEILVIAKTDIVPLFINLNCDFISPQESVDVLEKEIAKKLKLNPSIRLILFTFNNDEQVQHTQKKFFDQFVTTVSFEEQSESKFFDDIVRKTLGIKLV